MSMVKIIQGFVKMVNRMIIQIIKDIVLQLYVTGVTSQVILHLIVLIIILLLKITKSISPIIKKIKKLTLITLDLILITQDLILIIQERIQLRIVINVEMKVIMQITVLIIKRKFPLILAMGNRKIKNFVMRF